MLLILSIAAVGQVETLRVETATVNIPVSVYRRDGSPIRSLKREDLRVFEDGVEQDIAFFESGDSPFTIMLLADVSGSMKEHKAKMGRAMDSFISLLRPNDTLVVATYDSANDIDIRVKPTLRRDYRGPEPPSNRRGQVSTLLR